MRMTDKTCGIRKRSFGILLFISLEIYGNGRSLNGFLSLILFQFYQPDFTVENSGLNPFMIQRKDHHSLSQRSWGLDRWSLKPWLVERNQISHLKKAFTFTRPWLLLFLNLYLQNVYLKLYLWLLKQIGTTNWYCLLLGLSPQLLRLTC